MASKLSSPTSSIAHEPILDLSDQEDRQRHGKKRRRPMSKVAACDTCRKRKSRCSGGRPSCDACIQQARKCVYDVAPGFSRHKSMRHKLDLLEAKHKCLQDVMYQIRDGNPEQLESVLQRLKAGKVDGIEAMNIKSVQRPDSPADSLMEPISKLKSEPLGFAPATAAQRPHANDISQDSNSVLPTRHIFEEAVASYLNSVDVLFHAYTSAQAQSLLDRVFRSAQPVQPNSALTQLCSIAAVGSMCVSSAISVQTTRTLYNTAQYHLDSLMGEDTLQATKVVLMLACCDITKETTVAINHINLGLELSEKASPKPSQEPACTGIPEWLDRRRLWTTLTILKGWIFSTTDIPAETNWLACHRILQGFSFGDNMHWRDAIQLEMAKIVTIKADIRSVLYSTQNFQPEVFAQARRRLQEWCENLPQSMCLHSLLENHSICTEDRSRTLFAHLTYLSGLMLLPGYLARQWIATNANTAELSSVESMRGFNEGLSAAQQSARMLGLLRPQQDIIEKSWFCTSISYTSSTMLLFAICQELLYAGTGIYSKIMYEPAWKASKCLQLCASKDYVANLLYSRLQPHIAVIQAERSQKLTIPQPSQHDRHAFTIPAGDTALHRTTHALLDLLIQPFPIDIKSEDKLQPVKATIKNESGEKYCI